jgi:hypothetical protein
VEPDVEAPVRRSRRELFETIPDPYRGWVTARRARRWTRAVRFANFHNANLPINAPSASFYPMRLEPTAAVAHVLRRIGVRVVPYGHRSNLTVAWETGTWLSSTQADRLPIDALNRHCVDISKTHVDRVWAETAGYSIAVDPLTTSGPIVVKPDENGRRAGRVVHGPLGLRQPGFVYEQLIDSREGERIWSMRVALLCGRVVTAYVKWRPYPYWFRGHEVTVPCPPSELFSHDELLQLLEFARRMGMDYGELDVLRDRVSGLVYVVDANRTPVRPKGLDVRHDDAWFGPMTEAFAGLLKRG